MTHENLLENYKGTTEERRSVIGLIRKNYINPERNGLVVVYATEKTLKQPIPGMVKSRKIRPGIMRERPPWSEICRSYRRRQ